MEIKTLEVAGIGPAIHAMRNPFNSWDKSDTHYGRIGPEDALLSDILAKAGTEHAKHRRMCMVWVEIKAPLYWWKEFDTYRAGVEKVSCSTMHKITARPLEITDFEVVDAQDRDYLETALIIRLNNLMNKWKTEKNEDDWKKIIAELPQSYIQRRTVMISYQTLSSIWEQRNHHRLIEWARFRDWITTLPECWMITGEGLPKADNDDDE